MTDLYYIYCRSDERLKELKNCGYVYLFKCGDYYKIGYTENVERRVEELDRRPYSLNVLAVSRALLKPHARTVEQFLHNHFTDYKINGEWYYFDEYTVNRIVKFLNDIN